MVLIGVAKGLLTLNQGAVIWKVHIGGVRQILQQDVVFFKPLGVGVGRRQFLLDLSIRNDAPLFGIDQKHLSRLEPTLALDTLRLNL